jgi:hypothetical protein
MVLLRLVPQDCWLVIVLAQNERYHGWLDAQRFRFCSLMLSQRVGSVFLTICARAFLAKRSFNVGFGEKLLVPFSS